MGCDSVLIPTKSLCGVDAQHSGAWDGAGNCSDGKEQRGSADEGGWVNWGDAEEKTSHQSLSRARPQQSYCRADRSHLEALVQH